MHHMLLNAWTPKFPTPLLTLRHQWLRTTCHMGVMLPSPWLPHHLLCKAMPSPEEVTRQGVTWVTAQ